METPSKAYGDPPSINPKKPFDDITVSGVTFGNRQQVIATLKAGDTLYMFADPYGQGMAALTGDATSSAHKDPYAIMLCHFNRERQVYEPVGYVPKEVAPTFHPAVIARPGNNPLTATIRAVVGGPEKGRESYGLRVDLPALS